MQKQLIAERIFHSAMINNAMHWQRWHRYIDRWTLLEHSSMKEYSAFDPSLDLENTGCYPLNKNKNTRLV